ncbi:M14 family metallopeptidase [Pseudidiomarina sp. CB1]|uniref:M14 family metallopeptidase n=1 Tax=Pseudidiomarina sp. CB1 TaxID=2972484 RepID=UPI002163B481|nr:M14 family metallopeptidase [Pseudidiomarina sp. CB1]
MDVLKLMCGSLVFGIAALTSVGAVAAEQCQFAQVVIATDFDTARVDGCEKTAEHSYRLHLKPENLPINPSPWYAFRLEPRGLTAPQEINLTLVSHEGPARYAPKVSTDKHHWIPINYSKNDNRMQFKVTLQSEKSLYVAGQEIIDAAMYDAWLAGLPMGPNKSRFTLGYSAEERPIPAYQHSAGDGKPWFVIIGRQHPPEVTGALALMHFSNELMFSEAKALREVRSQFNILLVPLMNPDGVANGNWRHTTGGVDLNRDWFDLNEPESQSLHAFLQEREDAGEEVFFALDFHSTHYNIYYTMPADYVRPDGSGLEHPHLVNDWLDALAAKIDWEVKDKPGSNPDRGVFKQYVADTYAVHGVTYEVGDTTDRDEIKATAKAAAHTLAHTLLERLSSP